MLTETQYHLVKTIQNWDKSTTPPTAYFISRKMDMSVSNTHLNLRILTELGLVIRRKYVLEGKARLVRTIYAIDDVVADIYLKTYEKLHSSD
jgi:hypothetical protein